MARPDPFPVNEQGQLINPDYIKAEGERLRAGFADGTLGGPNIVDRSNGNVTNYKPFMPAPGANPMAIVVAPNSGMRDPVAGSFFNEPSIWERNQNPYEQRQGLELDTLRTRAAQLKFNLERDRQQAPVQDRLMEAQINASGGHDRFLREQDQQTLEHTAGFFGAMSNPNAPGPQDPGYDKYLLSALVKNPRFIETPGGKDFMAKLARTNDTHVSMADIKKMVPGYDVASVNMGPQGRSVNLKPVSPDAELAKSAKDYGLTLNRVRNPIGAEVGRRGRQGEKIGGKDVSGGFIGDEAGDIVRVENEKGEKVAIPMKEYLRLGGQLSPEGAARQGAAPAADLTALAQRALASPNATEAEKAAARRRLGL